MIRGRRLLTASLVAVWGSFLLACGGIATSDEAKEFSEANNQWEGGQKAEAVAKYKGMIGRHPKYFPNDSERPLVYQRVIEFEIERGDTSAARGYIGTAFDKQVTLPPGSKAMSDLVDQVRIDRARRDAEEQVRRQAEETRQHKEAEVAAMHKREEDEVRRKREEQEARERPTGEWRCISEIAQEETVRPGYHKTWAFKGDRVTINGNRQLWYTLDTNASPKRLDVYNKNGSRTINVYACIYKIEDDKLTVCFNAGDERPAKFGTGRFQQSFLLTFTK